MLLWLTNSQFGFIATFVRPKNLYLNFNFIWAFTNMLLLLLGYAQCSCSITSAMVLVVQSWLWNNSSWYRCQESLICHYQISETETTKWDILVAWQKTQIPPIWKTAARFSWRNPMCGYHAQQYTSILRQRTQWRWQKHKLFAIIKYLKLRLQNEIY